MLTRGILITLIVMFSSSFCFGNQLSEKQVKAVIEKDKNFKSIVVKTNAACKSTSGSILIKNGYGVIPKGYNDLVLETTDKIKPFFHEFANDRLFGASIILSYGKITNVKVLELAPIDNYNYEALLLLNVEPNEIGQLLGNITEMPVAVKFRFYNDGWKVEGLFLHKTKKWYSQQLVQLYQISSN